MRIFITGVSSGIGNALVKCLIIRGHEVWGIARRLDALEKLAKEVDSPAFNFDCCDITDAVANERLRTKMVSQKYVPDVVILNAAVDIEDAYPGLDFDHATQMMRTNVDGANFWVTAFIETFFQRDAGQFIAVSSIFAHWPDPASVSYSSSKAALSMLFRGLRIRYRKTNLQFKLLYLGPVDTPINPRFEGKESSGSLILASAPNTADYIANLIASKRSSSYYPLYIYGIFLFLRWLPDNWFELITSRFKR
ncbi:MAG: SDR family NAD(P)-dependent oxidoreductase [Halioglobus sp.]|nr:SDR family NAD(P)-dependent oxidoreductase [Halioglobus sp.]